jgi:hypothetical protein
MRTHDARRTDMGSPLDIAAGDKHVGLDRHGDYTVSTVRLLVDHGWNGEELWYETMVFRGDSFADLYCLRYGTHAEAEAGHAATVEALRAGTLDLYGD